MFTYNNYRNHGLRGLQDFEKELDPFCSLCLVRSALSSLTWLRGLQR